MPAAYRDKKPWSEKGYRKLRLEVLAQSDTCGLCLHPGAKTIDHVISLADWPKDAQGHLLPGYNARENLQPSHGTMGAGAHRVHNPCPVCSRLCNQSKGNGRGQRSPHSRQW